MKDHVKVTKNVRIGDDEPVAKTIELLLAYSDGLVDARFKINIFYGDYGYETTIEGWRPMTEKEIAAAQRRRKKERERKRKQREEAQAQQEKKDREEYERLKEKFE